MIVIVAKALSSKSNVSIVVLIVGRMSPGLKIGEFVLNELET
jgi:hypothetical protein